MVVERWDAAGFGSTAAAAATSPGRRASSRRRLGDRIVTDRDRIAVSRVVIGCTSTRVLQVDGDGPPVLLLHGFSDSADSWRPVLERLAAGGRRALAVDLPGSGWASPLGRPPMASLDHFVEALLSAYAEPDAVLVGNSLGGLAALRAAEREDLPLAGVVGVGPAGLGYGRWLTLLATANPLLDLVIPVLAQLPVPDQLVRFYAELMYEALMSLGRADRELVRRYASHWSDRSDLARLWGDVRALERDRQAVVHPAAIARQVLLIWGRQDMMTPVGAADQLLNEVSGAELVVLPDCGHCPQIQQPGRVADLIAAFAQAHGRARPLRPVARSQSNPVLLPSRYAHL